MKSNMLSDFVHYHLLLIKGKISFPDEMCGKSFCCNEQLYRVFLHVKKEPEKELFNNNKVFLRITFKVKHLDFLQRRLIPILSIPFFAGFSGFLSKMFCVNEETNSLQGVYEWESQEVAERYISSYPMKFMQRNAVAGSVIYEISAKVGDVFINTPQHSREQRRQL